MDFQVIMNQMIQIFLLISLGYFLYKVKLLDEGFNKHLSTLLVSVSMPCLITSSILSLSSSKPISEVAYVFLLAIITYILLPIIGLLLNKVLRVKKEDQPIYLFMHVFSNVAFMGFAVIESIFGAEGLFYTVIFNILFNIWVFSFGRMLFDREVSKNMSLKQFCSPVIICSFISIILYLLQVSIPSVVVSTIASVGSMTTPIAMLILGSSLAMIPVKEVFNDVRVYIYSFIRQVLLPIACFPILELCIQDELLKGVIFVILAMPIANIGVIFATQYEGNVSEVSKCVFMTTLFSIVTIPLLVSVFLM